MRLAIVHDDLMRRGGAEQVARCFHYAFPEAPIYTLAYQAEDTYPDFKKSKVITSWYQRFISDENQMKKFFFPLGILAMKQLDVTAYDVILISSTYCAKYVRISPKALVINYCHQPFRLAWYPESYTEMAQAKGFKKIVTKTIIAALRKIDFKSAQRTDFFIANTPETAKKIKDKYQFNHPIEVIYPPVVCEHFSISSKPKEYYLVVTRLEYYKRVDLVIKAFNQLELPLIIVGKGTKEKELKSSANSNIIFKSGLTNQELEELYADCKALVFPQLEDFGITPLEANASGRPVIAYGAGGVLNTMIPYQGNNIEKCTAIFFQEQSKESLVKAIEQMEKIYPLFEPTFIRNNAQRFEEKNFIKAIQRFVFEKYSNT